MSEIVPIPDYVITWSKSIGSQLSKIAPGLEFSEDGYLTVGESVPFEQVLSASFGLANMNRQTRVIKCYLEFALGHLINTLAARKDMAQEEIIIEHGFATEINSSPFRNHLRWAKMDAAVPLSYRFPGLLTSHYTAVALDVKGPEDKRQAVSFNRKKFSFLKLASGDPEKFNTAWLRGKMLSLREEFGLLESKPLLRTSVVKGYYLEVMTALMTFTDEEFEAHGTTRQDVMAWKDNYESQLLNLNALPNVAAEDYTFPFQKEATPEGQSEDDGPEDAEVIVEVESEEVGDSPAPDEYDD